MTREAVSTRHISGHIYHFYPHTTALKSEADGIANQLRKKGYKVRVLRVHSSWNKRWQYEIFTNPKHGDAKIYHMIPGSRK